MADPSCKIKELNRLFSAFKINAECIAYQKNLNYCFYDISLKARCRIKDLEKFSKEIGLSLKLDSKPSITLLPSEGLVRLEFYQKSNIKENILDLFYNKNLPQGGLQCLLGRDVKGNKFWFDLTKAPHILIAGTTGSGKSTILHTFIANMINYHGAKLFLMDPKNIEFGSYSDKSFKDLFISSDYSEAISMLDNLISTMELRYKLLREGLELKKLPYILIIIDEFSDLILQDADGEFYKKLCKLAQKCRAAKMHIILSTQRPSVDIISGAIKANFPVRIAFKTSSAIDSKVILDSNGAEGLYGNGDAFIKVGNSLERFQAAYASPLDIINCYAS